MTRRTPSRLRPAGGQVLDAAQPLDVALAVAAAAALGAGRVDQALALVDAQGLGVDAGQLGRHRDDVDGAQATLVGPVLGPWRSHSQVSSRGLGGGGGQGLDRLALGVGEPLRARRPRR